MTIAKEDDPITGHPLFTNFSEISVGYVYLLTKKRHGAIRETPLRKRGFFMEKR